MVYIWFLKCGLNQFFSLDNKVSRKKKKSFFGTVLFQTIPLIVRFQRNRRATQQVPLARIVGQASSSSGIASISARISSTFVFSTSLVMCAFSMTTNSITFMRMRRRSISYCSASMVSACSAIMRSFSDTKTGAAAFKMGILSAAAAAAPSRAAGGAAGGGAEAAAWVQTLWRKWQESPRVHFPCGKLMQIRTWRFLHLPAAKNLQLCWNRQEDCAFCSSACLRHLAHVADAIFQNSEENNLQKYTKSINFC